MSYFLILFFYFENIKINLIKYFKFFLYAIFFIIYYIFNSSNLFIAIGQLLIYISFVCAFIIGINSSYDNKFNQRYLRKFSFVLWAIISIHLVWVFFGLDDITGAFIGGFGKEETYIIFGRYGTTSMPYQFALYCASLFFFSLGKSEYSLGKKIFVVLILAVAMVLSDSRISLAALALTFFGKKSILFSPFLFFLLLILPVNEKMSALLNFDLSIISNDPSLAVRLINIEKYISWVDWSKLLFGGGAQSFLEFSEQYLMPGPLDMGYLRILCEFGLIGFFFLSWLLFISFKGSLIFKKNRIYYPFLFFLLIYLILNEGLFAGKSGHLVFFFLGYFFFKFKKYD